MTQTATAPATASSPTAAPGTAPAPAGRSLTEDVPRLLNRLQVAAVLVCLAFGVLAALVQVLAIQASGRAADNTEQVVRIQKIQSSLLRADALATNAFLVGGLESPDARAEYDRTVDQVNRLIAQAAEAQPADRTALAALNTQVSTYTNRITQARDNNRQGYPVGSAYLTLAGTGLRDEVLPIISNLVDADSQRAADEMDAQHPVWLLVLGVLALAGLFAANRMLAQRFHRRYNLGLLVAGGLVLLVALVAAGHALAKVKDNHDVRDGAYRTAVDEARARTAANDAKAQESAGLINRGSGAAYEQTFDDAADVVEEAATPETLELWQAYVSRHQAIRAKDDAGDWDGAVRLATAAGTASATAALNAVDAQAQTAADSAAREATDGFRHGSLLAWVLAGLSLLAALLAAGAVTWGVNQRRREYS